MAEILVVMFFRHVRILLSSARWLNATLLRLNSDFDK